MKIRFFDPPSGWRYGFPCEWPEGKTIEDLLKEHDYPEDMYDLAMKHSRMWQKERKEDENNT